MALTLFALGDFSFDRDMLPDVGTPHVLLVGTREEIAEVARRVLLTEEVRVIPIPNDRDRKARNLAAKKRQKERDPEHVLAVSRAGQRKRYVPAAELAESDPDALERRRAQSRDAQKRRREGSDG